LHPHPITVLRPEIQPSYLTTLERRIDLMMQAGMAWVIPMTFTSDVAEIECEDLALAFQELVGMKLLVMGPDAAFGRGAPKDTYERMLHLSKTAGFDVLRIEPLMHDHERYSSTAVRKALAEGDMGRVTALLGRHYSLSGPVVKGFERGRTIGFPTANISIAADRAMPALGVYATRAKVNGQRYLGATNIGRRPTFDAGHVSIETNLFDFAGDLYGQRMEIDFVERIRAEVKFGGIEELATQIAKDVAKAREILAS
ncbi:MAG: riboflavin biosynthesis protein RibF, partial [Dehalococcoidia bacterium]|nr:riboflavin biosynthesis protein RibF [Dehalococcoidia bacterium]